MSVPYLIELLADRFMHPAFNRQREVQLLCNSFLVNEEIYSPIAQLVERAAVNR